MQLSRHARGARHKTKNSLMSLKVIQCNLWILKKEWVFLFLYLKRHVSLRFLINRLATIKITFSDYKNKFLFDKVLATIKISFYSTKLIWRAESQSLNKTHTNIYIQLVHHHLRRKPISFWDNSLTRLKWNFFLLNQVKKVWTKWKILYNIIHTFTAVKHYCALFTFLLGYIYYIKNISNTHSAQNLHF